MLRQAGSYQRYSGISLIVRDDRQGRWNGAGLCLRPHLVSLLEKGERPIRKVGAHRRVMARDVLEYKARIDGLRQSALDELTSLSQENGWDTSADGQVQQAVLRWPDVADEDGISRP